nr:YheC/YheD family protein [Cytobacillus kochii]
MMNQTFMIEITSDNKGCVFLPNHINLNTALYKLNFGTVTINAKFKQQPSSKQAITISEDLAKDIFFPYVKHPLHIFIHDETLTIGPLVGIFTSGFTSFPMRPIGDRSIIFSKLLSVSTSVGALPFVFGERHINWDSGTIQGLFYLQNGWKTIEVPFPNVIYDRLPNRKSERQKQQKEVKSRLEQEYLIPWYNPGFFNKMDIYDRLFQVEEISEYLPETQPFSSYSAIENMLAKYGHIYIKPMNGSLGLGIHQIIYNREDSAYYCRYRDLKAGMNKLKKFSSLEGLMKHIFAGKNLERMIIQQGIYLLKKEKCAIDFRLHTNKDSTGQWNVTACAAKVAGNGSVTTHVKSGGTIQSLDEIFEDPIEREEIANKLQTASLKLSEAIENNMEGLVAEIGFDLGIDHSGKVWFFEANSKPGRSIFTHPSMKKFDFLTRKLSLAYSIYLTEQAMRSPEALFR